ncbi:MAG: hypothetical protein JSV44_10165 [Candidatus Zixiibacteriota bacterium]|nr:MAG: hypothetical protein JSV44_10165 [candidate division Zixibacteria bacterium]
MRQRIMNHLGRKTVHREYVYPVLLSLIFVTISYFLQHDWCESAMVQSEEIWQRRVEVHLSEYPFSSRYFTNYATLFIHRVLPLPFRESFFTLQFLLAFLLGPAFYFYLKQLGFDRAVSKLGLLLLYTAYPILAAHIQPVFTWDDIWVYLFLALAFGFNARKNLPAGAVFFLLASFAREQTIIFYPVYVVSIRLFCKDKRIRELILYMLLPLLIYLPFWLGIHVRRGVDPFDHLHFNFEHALRTSDSIFSALVSFGFIWFASAAGIIRLSRKHREAADRFLYWGAIYAIPISLAVVFCLGRARETRLFFPLYFLLVPLTLYYLQAAARFVRTCLRGWPRHIILLSILVFAGIGPFTGGLVFPNFDFRVCAEFAQNWIGIHFGLILGMLLLYLVRRLKRTAIE